MTSSSLERSEATQILEQIILGDVKHLNASTTSIKRITQAIVPGATRSIDMLPFVRLMRLVRRFIDDLISGAQFKYAFVKFIKEDDANVLHTIHDDLSWRVMRIRFDLAMFCSSPECRAESTCLIDETQLRQYTRESYDSLIRSVVDRVQQTDP